MHRLPDVLVKMRTSDTVCIDSSAFLCSSMLTKLEKADARSDQIHDALFCAAPQLVLGKSNAAALNEKAGSALKALSGLLH